METKRELRSEHKIDNENLFTAAWRKILYFEKNSEIDDIDSLYDCIVSELVNNPKSRFYIYG